MMHALSDEGKLPLISIIIAVYNGAKTLQRCIDSIANQTYSNIELIIIDGGSIDGTVDIIKNNEDIITYWESKPDRGIAHAWNKGIKRARGDWLYFLGADDVLFKDTVIQHIVKELTKFDKNVLLAYGKINMVSDKGVLLSSHGRPWVEVKKQFWVENTVPHQGCFHHRELFERVGLFSEDYVAVSDYELILRYVIDGGKVGDLTNIIVANMQVGGISNDFSLRFKTYLEFGKARKDNNTGAFSMAYAILLCKGLLSFFRVSK